MQRTLVIVQITLQEAIRRRLILFLVICCVLFIGTGAGCTKACRGFQESSLGVQKQKIIERIKGSDLSDIEKKLQLEKLETQVEERKKQERQSSKATLLTVIFGMIAFWLFLIAGLFTPFLITNDFQERTHVTLLARPIGRMQYLAGKFAAVLGMLLLNLVILLLAAHGFTYLVVQDPGWELLRGAAIYVEGLVVFAAMLTFLSLLLGRIPAAIVGLVIVGMGIPPGLALMAGNLAEQEGTTRIILYGLGYGLPQFAVNFFHGLSETMRGAEAASAFRKAGVNAGAHSLWINALWFVLFSVASVLVLKRKELDT